MVLLLHSPLRPNMLHSFSAGKKNILKSPQHGSHYHPHTFSDFHCFFGQSEILSFCVGIFWDFLFLNGLHHSCTYVLAHKPNETVSMFTAVFFKCPFPHLCLSKPSKTQSKCLLLDEAVSTPPDRKTSPFMYIKQGLHINLRELISPVVSYSYFYR